MQLRRLVMIPTMLIAAIHAAVAHGQILEFKFNDTGTTSTSTGKSPTVVTFYDVTETEADLHSAAGGGVAGDIAGHPDFETDRAFDNTASLGMQSLGGIALNLTDTSVSELDSWTVSGWYKTDGDQVLGGGGTVIFQSLPGKSAALKRADCHPVPRNSPTAMSIACQSSNTRVRFIQRSHTDSRTRATAADPAAPRGTLLHCSAEKPLYHCLPRTTLVPERVAGSTSFH